MRLVTLSHVQSMSPLPTCGRRHCFFLRSCFKDDSHPDKSPGAVGTSRIILGRPVRGKWKGRGKSWLLCSNIWQERPAGAAAGRAGSTEPCPRHPPLPPPGLLLPPAHCRPGEPRLCVSREVKRSGFYLNLIIFSVSGFSTFSKTLCGPNETSASGCGWGAASSLGTGHARGRWSEPNTGVKARGLSITVAPK